MFVCFLGDSTSRWEEFTGFWEWDYEWKTWPVGELFWWSKCDGCKKVYPCTVTSRTVTGRKLQVTFFIEIILVGLSVKLVTK